jgi:hypothetical protein
MMFFLPFFLSICVICLVCSIFHCKHSRCYYLPFPDSRIRSIVHISLHTARLSTIIINIKFRTLWSNSSITSNYFNYPFIFIGYYLFYNNVSILIELRRRFCFFVNTSEWNCFELWLILIPYVLGVILMYVMRIDLNDQYKQHKLDYIDNCVICLLFILAIFNIFIAACS